MVLWTVLREAARLYRQAWPQLLGSAAVVLAPAAILAEIFERAQVLTRIKLEGDGTLIAVDYGVVIVSQATFVIGYPLVESAAAEIVRQTREDGARSIRLVASRMRRAGPLAVVCTLLSIVAIAGGLALLIVPGLLLLARLSLVSQVVAIERRGLGALRRSWHLVRDSGWTAFTLSAMLIAAWVGLDTMTTALLDTASNRAAALVAAETVLMPFFAVAFTALYYRLVEQPLENPEWPGDTHRRKALAAADRLGPRSLGG